MSSSRLGENVRPGALVISRPIWAWYPSGNRRHSISTVVLVEGIRTPKWRVIMGPFRHRVGRQSRGNTRDLLRLNIISMNQKGFEMNDTMTLAERADALEHRMMRELD